MRHTWKRAGKRRRAKANKRRIRRRIAERRMIRLLLEFWSKRAHRMEAQA
jgi:hypothetical protein